MRRRYANSGFHFRLYLHLKLVWFFRGPVILQHPRSSSKDFSRVRRVGVCGFHPVRGDMFIDQVARPVLLRSEERNSTGAFTSQVPFRSSERSWIWGVRFGL